MKDENEAMPAFVPQVPGAPEALGAPRLPNEASILAQEAVSNNAAAGRPDATTPTIVDLSSPLSAASAQQILDALAARVRADSQGSQLFATEGDFSDLKQIKGASHSYWYSSRSMTDAYAKWAMLAQEDDTARTLVECTREESRLYPRPLCASSLANAPFNLSIEQLEESFQRIQESGDFPDIERLVASNGDIYYFSSEHLSRPRAEGLAEYYSVEIYYSV